MPRNRNAASAWAGAVALLVAPVAAPAAVVGLNFVGGAGDAGTLAPGDFAGAPEGAVTQNWNNLGSNAGTVSNVVAADGSPTGITVTWNAPGVWQLPDTFAGTNRGGAGGANPAMMKGYLDFTGDGQGQSTTVTLTGLNTIVPAGGTYSVVVYFDGDNGGNWRVANFDVNGRTAGGEDSENVNFNSGAGNNANGLFQIPLTGGNGNVDWPNSPNNGEGNMLVFTGLTDATVNLVATGGPNAGNGTFRAPVNGIQIITAPVPEPAAIGLLAVAGAGLLARRRRA